MVVGSRLTGDAAVLPDRVDFAPLSIDDFAVGVRQQTQIPNDRLAQLRGGHYLVRRGNQVDDGAMKLSHRQQATFREAPKAESATRVADCDRVGGSRNDTKRRTDRCPRKTLRKRTTTSPIVEHCEAAIAIAYCYRIARQWLHGGCACVASVASKRSQLGALGVQQLDHLGSSQRDSLVCCSNSAHSFGEQPSFAIW